MIVYRCHGTIHRIYTIACCCYSRCVARNIKSPLNILCTHTCISIYIALPTEKPVSPTTTPHTREREALSLWHILGLLRKAKLFHLPFYLLLLLLCVTPRVVVQQPPYFFFLLHLISWDNLYLTIKFNLLLFSVVSGEFCWILTWRSSKKTLLL